MSSASPSPEEPEPRDWVDRFILPFVREPTLWPVLIVLVAHVVAFLGPAMIFAVRDGGRGSMAVLALLAALSALVVRFEWRREGRPSALTALTVTTWAASIAFAYLAHHTHIF
jgi:hypothetical protein